MLSRKPIVALWMYRNDGGDVIQEKLKDQLGQTGCVVFNDFDMRDCYVRDGRVYTRENWDLSSADILYHMNADEHTPFQGEILRALEFSGVTVVNSWRSYTLAKDKFLTNMLLSKNGVAVPRSALINGFNQVASADHLFGRSGKVLVKPRGNHGGKGIVKMDSREMLRDFLQATSPFMADYYIEEFIPFGDRDYRVEIFNSMIIGGYSRQVGDSSYKTNVSSGGHMLDAQPPEEAVEVALKSAEFVGVTTTIVDLIRSDDDQKVYVLEVNPIMGIFVEQACIEHNKPFFNSKASYCNDQLKLDCLTEYLRSLAIAKINPTRILR